MSEQTLLPDVPRPLRRYEVTVTLMRVAAGHDRLPLEDHAVAALAAAAVAAEGLLTAWTWEKSVVSMLVEKACDADAVAAGEALVRALGSSCGASVEVRPVSA